MIAALLLLQPLVPHVPTLEVLALNSDYVFVGRMVEYCPEWMQGPEVNAVVLVEDILKGKTGLSPLTGFRVAGRAEELKDWARRGNRLLFFEGKTVDLSLPKLGALDSRLRVVDRPEEVLDIVRKTLRRHPGVLRIRTRSVPMPEALLKRLDLGPYGQVILPDFRRE